MRLKIFSKNFEMKDMGETSYMIGISIYKKRPHGLLGFSKNAYIEKILKKFNMNNYLVGIVPLQKVDAFSLMQCPKNAVERKQMKSIPYASDVGSLMYLQSCTRPDISFIL